MDKQSFQPQQQPQALKSEKKLTRFAPGINRNFSSAQQIQYKGNSPLSEQNVGSNYGDLQNHVEGTCSSPVQQTNDPSSSATSSITQQGFFRRKMHLKMSTTGLKVFNTKQVQPENPSAFSFKKPRFTSNHISQGNPLLPGGQSQQQFSSQHIQPNQQNASSAATISSHFGLHTANSRAENHTVHSSISAWVGNHRPVIPSSELNSNQLSRGIRSSGFQRINKRANTALSSVKNEEQVEKQVGILQNTKQETNEESKEESITAQHEKVKKLPLRKLSLERNADYESSYLEESQTHQESYRQVPMENYSHNTESTNVTTAQSNSVSQHAFFDAANPKVKLGLPDTHSGQVIQAKKKIQEAKQFSNQVRQQIFEMQNQDEEENFLQLCETLQKITHN